MAIPPPADTAIQQTLKRVVKPRVLVGFAEAMAAAEVVWSLVDRGFEVIAFARRGRRCALRHSRYVTCRDITPPELDMAAALSELCSLIEYVGREVASELLVVFPLDDNAVWLCDRVPLPSGSLLAGPRGKTTELALDKHVQICAAMSAGFDVPVTRVVTSVDELRKVKELLPLVLRPAKAVWFHEGHLCKGGSWVCANHRELEKAITKWAGQVPLLVQPFIVGTGEGVFGLAADGEVRGWSAHRRLRMMNPQGSGSSACVSQSVPDEVRLPVARLIRETGWRGLFMVETLRDRSGRVWFIEFNGRPWGSMALSRRQGFEYPAWAIDLALDPRSLVGLGSTAPTTVVCRNLAREFLHLLFVLRGPRSAAFREWPSLWKTVGGLMSIRAGQSLYNWRKDDPKVLFGDLYHTICANLFKSRN